MYFANFLRNGVKAYTTIVGRSTFLRFTAASKRAVSQLQSTSTSNYCTLLNAVKPSRSRTSQLILRRSQSDDAKFGTQKIAIACRLKDGIPNNYELIYRFNSAYTIVCIQVLNIIGIVTITFGLIRTLLPENFTEQLDEASRREEEDRDNLLKSSEGSKLFSVKNSDERLPTPSSNEMTNITMEQMGIMLLGVAGLMIALIRIQRVLPIRLYTSSTGHSYAVFYGSIIPGRTTKREFIAGTVKKQRKQSPFLATDSLFVDGTGHNMVLLDYCFRMPADFNYILGIKKSSDGNNN